jgi:hypothetical protein
MSFFGRGVVWLGEVLCKEGKRGERGKEEDEAVGISEGGDYSPSHSRFPPFPAFLLTLKQHCRAVEVLRDPLRSLNGHGPVLIGAQDQDLVFERPFASSGLFFSCRGNCSRT